MFHEKTSRTLGHRISAREWNKGAEIKVKGECRSRKVAFEKLGIGNKAEEILVPGQLCIQKHALHEHPFRFCDWTAC